MVTLDDSNLVPRFPSRAHPRVQGSIFATKHQTVHQGPSLTRSVSHFQALQGKSTSSPKRLHRVDHSNQQFSILALSDTSGAVVERIAYQAYGQPTFMSAAGTTLSSSAKAIRYSYTGREWDPSLELHHFRARWMSGVSGRFASRDPLSYQDGQLDYAANFVPTANDPTGMVVVLPVQAVLNIGCPEEGKSKIVGAVWSFRRSYRGRRCSGWMIQEIRAYCNEIKCGGVNLCPSRHSMPTASQVVFYEAWRVSEGSGLEGTKTDQERQGNRTSNPPKRRD